MTKFIVMAAFFLLSLTAYGQVAVKTNLLYDVATTPNISVEAGFKGNNTINLAYGLNPWSFSSGSHGKRYAKHWVLMPEYRWWTCSRFNGHFFGVHAMGGQMNVSNVDIPVPGFFFSGTNIRNEVRDHRVQGSFAGAGVTYGYQWILSRHVNIEGEVGIGYARAWFDKFACGDCGARLGRGHANYAGITKLGISVLYIF